MSKRNRGQQGAQNPGNGWQNQQRTARVDADDDVQAILATLPDDLLKSGYLRAFKEGNPLLAAWWALRVIGINMAAGLYRADLPGEICKCFPQPRWPSVGDGPSANCNEDEVNAFAALYLHAVMGMEIDFVAEREVVAPRLP